MDIFWNYTIKTCLIYDEGILFVFVYFLVVLSAFINLTFREKHILQGIFIILLMLILGIMVLNKCAIVLKPHLVRTFSMLLHFMSTFSKLFSPKIIKTC